MHLVVEPSLGVYHPSFDVNACEGSTAGPVTLLGLHVANSGLLRIQYSEELQCSHG